MEFLRSQIESAAKKRALARDVERCLKGEPLARFSPENQIFHIAANIRQQYLLERRTQAIDYLPLTEDEHR